MTSAAALTYGFACGAVLCGGSAAWAAVSYAGIARRRSAALDAVQLRERARAARARRFADAAHESVDAVAACIGDAVAAAVSGAYGILIFAPVHGELACVHAAGERVRFFLGYRIAGDDGDALTVRALRSRHRATLDGSNARCSDANAAAALALPLLIDEQTYAALEILARRTFTERELDDVTAIAEDGALAWRVAQERDRDRRRAEYDALTGLLTPAELRRRLARLIARSSTLRTSRFALLFIDTDHFKAWNDAYGHAAGDTLLRELALLLRRAAASPDDLIARNGGDEFCLVLCDTEKPEAIGRAELLRCAVRALGRTAERAVRVTASIGVAAYPVDAVAAADLLERADAAMYCAKRGGRDAIAFFDTGGELAAMRAGDTIETNRERRVEG